VNVDEALFAVENLGHDLVSEPARTLAAEVRRLRGELERLPFQVDDVARQYTERHHEIVQLTAERDALAAKVEAGAAVVRAWRERTNTDWVHPEFRLVLDELVRVYGEGEGS
jgi:uncharacterized protein involved in exopolysaccharide biosynthesis